MKRNQENNFSVVTLDAKYRISFHIDILTPELSDKIGQIEFVYTIGPQGQLQIKPAEHKLDFDTADDERYNASIMKLAVSKETHRVRITIPVDIRKLIQNISQEGQNVVILGLDRSFEIWNPEKYLEFAAKQASLIEARPCKKEVLGSNTGKLISARAAYREAEYMGIT